MIDVLNPYDCPRCGQHESYGCSCTRIEQLVAERDAKDARIADMEAMQEVLMRGGKALQARAEASEAKLAVAVECLTGLSQWRQDCHRYDADCGHELRVFDIDDVAMMESDAYATLAQLKGTGQ